MYYLLATFVVLSAAGVIMVIRAARCAPEGYQDAKGFHALNPDDLAGRTPTDAAFSFDEVLFLEKQLSAQPWR